MKQKHVTYIQKTKQSAELDTEMTQMFNLVHKDFDVAVTNMFKNLQQICVMMNKTRYKKIKIMFLFL